MYACKFTTILVLFQFTVQYSFIILASSHVKSARNIHFISLHTLYMQCLRVLLALASHFVEVVLLYYIFQNNETVTLLYFPLLIALPNKQICELS